MGAWSAEDRALAVRLRGEGLSAAEVAARIGCHPITVYSWSRKAAEREGRRSTGAPAPRPLAERERAVALYQDGATIREIEQLLGVHNTTVLRWLRAAGVPRRPPARRTEERCLAPAD